MWAAGVTSSGLACCAPTPAPAPSFLGSRLSFWRDILVCLLSVSLGSKAKPSSRPSVCEIMSESSQTLPLSLNFVPVDLTRSLSHGSCKGDWTVDVDEMEWVQRSEGSSEPHRWRTECSITPVLGPALSPRLLRTEFLGRPILATLILLGTILCSPSEFVFTDSAPSLYLRDQVHAASRRRVFTVCRRPAILTTCLRPP